MFGPQITCLKVILFHLMLISMSGFFATHFGLNSLLDNLREQRVLVMQDVEAVQQADRLVLQLLM